jgi:signal transduction histidine kinase/AraC-like DNA-binding protein
MRLINFSFILFFVFFFSCSSKQETKKFSIGFSQCTVGDAWRKAMHEEMQRELSFYPDLELEITDAQNSSSTQIDHIRKFIDQEVDLLIVSPNEAEPITSVVEEAFEKGIPVIIVDRKTNSSLYTAYVGANNYEIGKLAGDYVSKLLNGKGNIVEIWGLRGSTPAIERHKGFIDAIAASKGLSIVAEVDGEWERGVVKTKMPASYDEKKNIDLVFAHNDMMALGAYEYLKSIDKHHDLQFIGIDGLGGPHGGLQAVEDGILKATFLYPTGGEEVIQLANKILHGESFNKENMLESTVIDSRNVQIMQQQINKILGQQKNIERQQHLLTEQIRLYDDQRTLLYILLACLSIIIVLGGLAVKALREKHEMNKALVVNNKEISSQRDKIAVMARKADKANEAKLKFFTNISHEFRTPLTLILGPVEDSLKSNISAELKKDMVLVRNNAVRLLRLVNQLMDFRKIEHKKMKLKAGERDLIRFINEVGSSFARLASKRNIRFRIISKHDKLNLYFDADKLDKVLFNLLSNAFKFTQDGGQINIKVELADSDENVTIIVEDNGRGMSATLVEHAFDRFYTGDTTGNLSTGIGLALSKEFIKLHKGTISVVSEESKGTKFFITLPLGKDHLSMDEISTDIEDQASYMIQGLVDADEGVYEESFESEKRFKEHSILVIEDNKELRDFLKSRLIKDFNVEISPNGLLGLNKAFETVPDLVICDVMLPNQNGFEITSTLKSDLRTSHIPVILLTAQDAIEHKIEGIQSGADLYITKPFSYQYLLERVKGLIKNREILREHYSTEISVDTKTVVAPKQLDKKFVNEVTAIIEKNLSNPDLNATTIATELGMSKVQVYRKMKALVGYSLNDYVVNMRLKKARHLLLHSKMNISEIAYEVGFSSPAYFSTAFKTHFNMSPSDFKTNRLDQETVSA